MSASHDVGWIQPFASVVVYRAKDERIVAASANLRTFVQGIGPEQALDRPAEQVLGSSLIHSLRNAQGLPVFHESAEPLGEVDLGCGPLESSAFATNGCVVVELMEGQPQPTSLDLSKDIARLSERMQDASDVTSLLTKLASLIRIMSGYDRVQALRNTGNDTCVVIAESRRGKLPDCLGETLPFTADPHPPFHYIRDVSDVAVPVQAHEAMALDLSLLPTSKPRAGRLDSLNAQEMRAELVLPLSAEGRRWGALLFQSGRPRAPTPRFRQSCRAIRPLLDVWLARFEASAQKP